MRMLPLVAPALLAKGHAERLPEGKPAPRALAPGFDAARAPVSALKYAGRGWWLTASRRRLLPTTYSRDPRPLAGCRPLRGGRGSGTGSCAKAACTGR